MLCFLFLKEKRKVMNMRKLTTMLLVLLIAITFLPGCSNNTAEETSVEPVEASDDVVVEEPLMVACLIPESINDGGWSAGAYYGLLKIEEVFGAEISYTENVELSDHDEVFRMYAVQGYDIIFAHGNEFADSAARVAPEFPDVQFCVTASIAMEESNLSSVNTDNAQQGFIEGVVAATITKSDVVGIIGGMDIPSISDSVIGFELGAKYVNPDVRVISTYVGDFMDAARAKEIATSMIDEGADVLMHNAGPAGNGLFEACEDAGVYALGSIVDQAEVAPDTIVTSGIADMPMAFKVFTDMYLANGSPIATSVALGIKENTVYLAPYHDFEDVLTAEQKDSISQVVEDIRNDILDIRDLGTFSM